MGTETENPKSAKVSKYKEQVPKYKELVAQYKEYTIYNTSSDVQGLLILLTVIFAILAIALLASWDVDQKNVNAYDKHTCEVLDKRYQYYTCKDIVDCSCSGCTHGIPSCSILTIIPNTTTGSIRCCGSTCCAQECCDTCCEQTCHNNTCRTTCRSCNCYCCRESNRQCTQLYGQCGNIYVFVDFGRQINYTENCFFRDTKCFEKWARFNQQYLPCWWNGSKLKFDEPDVNEHVFRAGLAFAALLGIMIIVWFIQPAIMFMWFAHKHRFVYYNEEADRHNAKVAGESLEHLRELEGVGAELDEQNTTQIKEEGAI